MAGGQAARPVAVQRERERLLRRAPCACAVGRAHAIEAAGMAREARVAPAEVRVRGMSVVLVHAMTPQA